MNLEPTAICPSLYMRGIIYTRLHTYILVSFEPEQVRREKDLDKGYIEDCR
jgi:hypothetical protein